MKVPLYLSIAGLYYHYNPSMPNRMVGYIKAEPDNSYDTNAIGVYSNEFGLIGYIPKYQTELVRAWANTRLPNFKCEINLEVNIEYNRYIGSVTIFDTDESYCDNPYNGRRVYLCNNRFSLFGIKYVIEGFGAKISSRLSKLTDIVIYENDLTEVVKNKVGIDGYNFEILTLTEFIQNAIPQEKRVPNIFGKVVTPSSVGESAFDEFIQSYILIEGGVYKKGYSKSETETVVLKSSQATQMSAKALMDGKTILKCEDLMPALYKVLSRQQSGCATPKGESFETSITDISLLESVSRQNKPNKSNKEVSNKDSVSGCVVIIAIVISIVLYLLL